MNDKDPRPVCLTIAGVDPSGGGASCPDDGGDGASDGDAAPGDFA